MRLMKPPWWANIGPIWPPLVALEGQDDGRSVVRMNGSPTRECDVRSVTARPRVRDLELLPRIAASYSGLIVHKNRTGALATATARFACADDRFCRGGDLRFAEDGGDVAR